MKSNHTGLWLIDAATLTLTWAGDLPIPKPSLKERIRFAQLYIKSKGHGPTFFSLIKRLAKAVAFCLNPGQVAWSGKSKVTTGRPFDEAWNNFNVTECVSPQSGQGAADNLADKSSK
ncbi:MAG: hypothetical protein K2K68_02550 [Duncaniella sp.]|nr:hypothetical protein [Duncaniella sp.]